MDKTKTGGIALGYTVAVIAVFAGILLIPASRQWFSTMSSAQPYIMGFFKFALLATAGEILALLTATKQWQLPKKFLGKMIVWGFLGIIISLAFQVFSYGTAGAIEHGYLPGKGSKFVSALMTSITMNVMFAPAFMSFHRITDKMFNLRAEGRKVGFVQAVGEVDWKDFVSFVLFKTLPILWVPAHTISFLLPPEYRIIFAAALSMLLGVILVLATKKK